MYVQFRQQLEYVQILCDDLIFQIIYIILFKCNSARCMLYSNLYILNVMITLSALIIRTMF